MEHTLERIRQRAYEIWDADGRADGKAGEHWLAAEREVLSSLSARSPAPKASARRKAHKLTLVKTRRVAPPVDPHVAKTDHSPP
jgi:Protein of unknown function (DUF2934)